MLFEEVGDRRDLGEIERRDVEKPRGLGGFRNIGHDGDRVRRRHLVDEIGLIRTIGAARRLREIGAERCARARTLDERLRHAHIGLVARAHDLDGGKAAFTVSLDDDDVMSRHGADDLRALNLVLEGLHACEHVGRRDDGLGCARRAMSIGVFAGMIDVEADVRMVLDRTDVMPAIDHLGDQLLDKGGFPRVMAADDGDRRTWNVDHVTRPLRT